MKLWTKDLWHHFTVKLCSAPSQAKHTICKTRSSSPVRAIARRHSPLHSSQMHRSRIHQRWERRTQFSRCHTEVEIKLTCRHTARKSDLTWLQVAQMRLMAESRSRMEGVNKANQNCKWSLNSIRLRIRHGPIPRRKVSTLTTTKQGSKLSTTARNNQSRKNAIG